MKTEHVIWLPATYKTHANKTFSITCTQYIHSSENGVYYLLQ